MDIQQEMVYYEKSQSTAKRLQKNYSNVAYGAHAEPEEQNTELMGDCVISEADDFDGVPDIEMLVWEQDIPRHKLETSMDAEMSVIPNNKGGWLTTVLTSAEEQHLDTSQNGMRHSMAEIQSISQVCCCMINSG